MRIGIPKEIKPGENRVALTRAGVASFRQAGHEVLVERSAGSGSGFEDADYAACGANIVPTNRELYATSDIIMKVKEPLQPEYDLLRDGQVLFAYLHLAAEPALTRVLMDNGVVSIAFETVQLPNGSLPLLQPMSEVAGRMAVQIGARLLEKAQGGRGVLLGGVPGVPPASVVIIGGGTVGTNAAKIAVGMGARVTILDTNVERLRYLDDVFYGRLQTQVSNVHNIGAAVEQADLLIGAVLVPGARAPRLVAEEMVRKMKPGSVIVDVAIDQGGSIATVDRITTHENPTYVRYGVVHYSVANMPGAVPRTSTIALANATLPYALELANQGWRSAVRANRALAGGVNVVEGCVTCKGVAEAHQLPFTPLAQVIGW